MILEIKNLSVQFLKPVVNGVSLSVEEGSWTSLVGESGSGKTVTALSICRLLKARRFEGEINFYSKKGERTNLAALPESALEKIRGKEIAYVFQDPASSLNPLMRVGEQIKETSLTTQKAKEALASVSIRDVDRVYSSFPHELSGGMKQRVMIAMALAGGPRLLIADEPTTALDSSTEKEIMELLLRAKRENSLSILFITHNLELATRFSEKIVVMREGKITELLEKRDGFAAKESYTKKLFRAQLTNAMPKSMIEI